MMRDLLGNNHAFNYQLDASPEQNQRQQDRSATAYCNIIIYIYNAYLTSKAFLLLSSALSTKRICNDLVRIFLSPKEKTTPKWRGRAMWLRTSHSKVKSSTLDPTHNIQATLPDNHATMVVPNRRHHHLRKFRSTSCGRWRGRTRRTPPC